MRDIQTTIMGNATADPTAHPQDDGSVTVKVRVAVTGRYFNAASQDYSDRKTEFLTVFVRRQLARNVLLSVRKGQALIVTGRLNSSEWTGEDGAQRFSLNLQAEAIGHDLTYGTSAYRRPLRGEDVPDIDPYSGETVERGTASRSEGDDDTVAGTAASALTVSSPAEEGETDSLTGEKTSEEDSLAPAF